MGGVTMIERLQSESTDTWLVNLPPTPRQSRAAVVVAIVLLVGLGVSVPFADVPLRRIDSFIPTLEGAVTLTDLITSVLLFSQARIYHSRALVALASGYLFTALIVIPHMLTFPNAFSPTGLIGAGLQSTGWLYIFWHFGLPTALLVYAHLKNEKLNPVTQAPNTEFVGYCIAIVVGLVCGLTWLSTSGEALLPRVFLDRTHLAPFNFYVLPFAMLISAAALAVLSRKQRAVLDQWLMVVIIALISELMFNGVLISGRFTLGWYVSRIFSLITSTIVLIVLLEETTRLQGRLARSNAMLRRERSNKLMNLGALAASISHEVRQPLTTITMSGSTILQSLGATPPKLEKIRSAAERTIAAGYRANEILNDVRDLFTAKHQQVPIVVNDVILEALRVLDRELKDHNVATRVELKSELPPVAGNSGQLREVVVNLIQNAIDAMKAFDYGQRVLRVSSEHDDADAIRVEVEDTGPGIDPKKRDNIFDAFFTTKPHGTGLGLAICRMVVERHEGRLSVSSADPHGTIFRITLPQMKLPH